MTNPVVQECLNVVLRRAEIALPPEAVRIYSATVLAPPMQVLSRDTLYHRRLDAPARRSFGGCDSLDVAGALSAGCSALLSEEVQQGERIEGLTVFDPSK